MQATKLLKCELSELVTKHVLAELHDPKIIRLYLTIVILTQTTKIIRSQ